MGGVIHGLVHSLTNFKERLSSTILRRHPSTTNQALEKNPSPQIPLYQKPYVIVGRYNDVIQFLKDHPDMSFLSGTSCYDNATDLYGEENINPYALNEESDCAYTTKQQNYGCLKMSINLDSEQKEGLFASFSSIASKLINYITYEHALEFAKGVIDIIGRVTDFSLDLSESTNLELTKQLNNPKIVLSLSPLLNENYNNVTVFDNASTVKGKDLVTYLEEQRIPLLKTAIDPYKRKSKIPSAADLSFLSKTPSRAVVTDIPMPVTATTKRQRSGVIVI